MAFYFITGNKDKFEEVKHLIPEIEQLDIDLPEIQEIDPKEIVKYKLQSALAHHKGSFIVDDTGIYLSCLNGFPGPLSKWLEKSIGSEGIYNLTAKLNDSKAEAKAVIGYVHTDGEFHFFEGVVKGQIVQPRGKSGFGWDPVFLPDGQTKTYAEMTREEKTAISHRTLAVNKLKEFLDANSV